MHPVPRQYATEDRLSRSREGLEFAELIHWAYGKEPQNKQRDTTQLPEHQRNISYLEGERTGTKPGSCAIPFEHCGATDVRFILRSRSPKSIRWSSWKQGSYQGMYGHRLSKALLSYLEGKLGPGLVQHLLAAVKHGQNLTRKLHEQLKVPNHR